MPAEETIAAARAALSRGDLLAAFDTLQRMAGEEHPALDYLRVLTLARLGDTDRALKLYDVYRLGERGDVDALSLKARLLKDQAFALEGRVDLEAVDAACELYAAVYRRTRNTYPAINAATLAWIAGRPLLAQQLARAALKAPAAPGGAGDYYAWATRAEALLILGEPDEARAALAAALAAPGADVGARSTTVLQLKRLASALPPDAPVHELLAMIAPPAVAHFCGHIFLEDAALEADLAARVREEIAGQRVGYAYGALAAGSDILIAEQLLAAGCELHVVLPVAEPDFIAQSLAPAGEAWIRRYEACRDRAASLTFSSQMSHVGGQGQFAYGSSVAMGMARLRARQLQGQAVQIAIAEPQQGAASLTRSDITAWRSRGGISRVVESTGMVRPPKPPVREQPGAERGTYGLMFTDFPGFARLAEPVLPVFQEEVMARAARVLDAHADAILYSNTWGDALYVVYKDAVSSAETALQLCAALGEVNPERLGLRQGAAMRIALHFGPTYYGVDAVTRRVNYYGSEVSRAARIEPVTPAGSVYVTEPFAAILEMQPGHAFTCDYVGVVELAKGYGAYPLYHLTRRGAAATPRRRKAKRVEA